MAIAADLGATKVTVGIVGGANQLTSYREERTPAGAAAVRRLIELVCRVHDEGPAAVCVGVGTWSSGGPGPLSGRRRAVFPGPRCVARSRRQPASRQSSIPTATLPRTVSSGTEPGVARRT